VSGGRGGVASHPLDWRLAALAVCGVPCPGVSHEPQVCAPEGGAWAPPGRISPTAHRQPPAARQALGGLFAICHGLLLLRSDLVYCHSSLCTLHLGYQYQKEMSETSLQFMGVYLRREKGERVQSGTKK
jgi:hypothetical protein